LKIDLASIVGAFDLCLKLGEGVGGRQGCVTTEV